MNVQLGKCNLGTFDLGKRFLDRTFPVNNYSPSSCQNK